MSGSQERFLREIAGRIGADRIVEAHVFPPLRQGGAETGVAVVAATRDTGEEQTPDDDDAGRASGRRLTVYTARYRIMLKGLERGRWEFDVVADADAPLGIVDTVVRGVQRRTGDVTECERLGPDAFAERETGSAWPPTT